MPVVQPEDMTRLRRYQTRFALVVVAVLLISAAAGFGYIFSLPGVGDTEAPLVHRILAEHHAAFTTLPPPSKLGAAVLTVEGEHFCSNIFADIVYGAGRAVLASSANGDPGGSTIAQQVAKQLYTDGSGLGAALEDLGLAVKLSLQYSRPQVLDMWLNAVYYGNGYWGAEAPAEGYFRVSPRSLDWAEAAMLAGLPQAPSAYDPLVHLALARQRQLHVIAQLVATHTISQSQANAAIREKLRFRRS
jgi:membrane peptidoglycan carboxypeptidase